MVQPILQAIYVIYSLLNVMQSGVTTRQCISSKCLVAIHQYQPRQDVGDQPRQDAALEVNFTSIPSPKLSCTTHINLQIYL